MESVQKMHYMVYPGVTFQHVNINEYIINEVCKFYGITPEQMRMKTRKQTYKWPRQLCQTLMMKYGNNTLRSVATLTGVSNHATVLNSKKQVENIVETNRIERNTWELLTKYVQNAASSHMQLILRLVSDEFNVGAITIINEPEQHTRSYAARCCAVWLMQTYSKLNNQSLAGLFNCQHSRIVSYLDHRLRLAAADKHYMDQCMKLREMIMKPGKK